MYTETDQHVNSDPTAALNGVLAVLVATGLTDDQIAAATGRDPRPVRALLDAAAEPPAGELSVIDRARTSLAARS
jgi:hypothetical protein